MKLKILILGLLIGQIAFANELTKEVSCVFTEPFFTIKIDVEKGQAVMIRPNYSDENGGEETLPLAERVDLVLSNMDLLAPSFTLVDQDGKALMLMIMNFSGSNGMSSAIYPITAFYELEDYGTLEGGCETDKVKGFNPDEL